MAPEKTLQSSLVNYSETWGYDREKEHNGSKEVKVKSSDPIDINAYCGSQHQVHANVKR